MFAAPPPPSSPRSVLPERGVAKSGREGASPAENRSDLQPQAVGAAVRSGHARWRAREQKKRDFQKLKRMHKSHPLDPPLKPDVNLATPLLRPFCPMLIHQEHIAAGDADFPDKGSMGSSPRAVNKISCSFEGRSPRRSGARWGRKGKPPPPGSAGLGPRVPPTSARAPRGGREQAGAFRARPLPRVPWLPERRACPRVCSYLARAGESARSCSEPRAGEVGAGGASASEADISSAAAGSPIRPMGKWQRMWRI